MKTIKGPGLFLAQFAGDAAPFNSWDSITKWAADCGYVGVQIPSWDGRLFDLENSTVKFQRNQHAETVDATFLGSDWRKFALVLDDKSVEVHNHQGKVFSSKLPKPARSMCFDTHEATLCVGGTSSNIYRLDLYKGLFRSNF